MISLIYGIQKNDNMLIDRENRLVVARGRGWEVEEMGEGGQNAKKIFNKLALSN